MGLLEGRATLPEVLQSSDPRFHRDATTHPPLLDLQTRKRASTCLRHPTSKRQRRRPTFRRRTIRHILIPAQTPRGDLARTVRTRKCRHLMGEEPRYLLKLMRYGGVKEMVCQRIILDRLLRRIRRGRIVLLCNCACIFSKRNEANRGLGVKWARSLG